MVERKKRRYRLRDDVANKKRRLDTGPASDTTQSSSEDEKDCLKVEATVEPPLLGNFSTSDGLHFQPALGVTSNGSYPDWGDAWSFERLMGSRRTLQSCILISYYLSPTWLVSIIPPHVKVRLVSHHSIDKVDTAANTYELPTAPNFSHTVPQFSRKGGKGCMHIKLFIFFHEKHTRIVISSANLFKHNFDQIENQVWLCDFRTVSVKSEDLLPPSPFYSGLDKTLRLLDVEPNLWQSRLSTLDYSAVDRTTRLILSVGGSHATTDEQSKFSYGAPALGKALRELGFSSRPGEQVKLEFQSSSTGEYDEAWLNWFHKHISNQERQLGSSVCTDIRLVYPSQTEVDRSIHLGEYASGSCQPDHWLIPEFKMRKIVREARCKRAGIICHNKCLSGIITRSQGYPPTQRPRAFICVGSHNFTKAAWGRKHTDGALRTTGAIDFMNTELSVVSAISTRTTAEADKILDRLLPYQRPLLPYNPGDVPLMKGDRQHKIERKLRWEKGNRYDSTTV